MDCLKHLGYQFGLGAGRHKEHLAIKVNRTPLVFGFREHFSHGLQHTKALVTDYQLNTIQSSI